MVSAARPGAYFVDFLLFLKYVPEWFPGADFKRVAREGWELAQELQIKPFAWAKKQFDEGHAEPSFFRKLMDTTGGNSVEEQKIIKSACAVLYASMLVLLPFFESRGMNVRVCFTYQLVLTPYSPLASHSSWPYFTHLKYRRRRRRK
jgi:hypothetical protein